MVKVIYFKSIAFLTCQGIYNDISNKLDALKSLQVIYSLVHAEGYRKFQKEC